MVADAARQARMRQAADEGGAYTGVSTSEPETGNADTTSRKRSHDNVLDESDVFQGEPSSAAEPLSLAIGRKKRRKLRAARDSWVEDEPAQAVAHDLGHIEASDSLYMHDTGSAVQQVVSSGEEQARGEAAIQQQQTAASWSSNRLLSRFASFFGL